MADAGTRLCVGIVGTSTIGRIRVNLGAEETVVRAELVTKAAKSFALGRKVLVAHERTKDLEPWWYIGKIKLYTSLRRLRSVQEGMPLSQLPRQVYQEGDRQCAGGRRPTRRWTGAHEGQLRARRVVAPTRAVGGVSARAGRSVCRVCAVQERYASALVRWLMPIGRMPHTPCFAKKSRLRRAHNFRNWLS